MSSTSLVYTPSIIAIWAQLDVVDKYTLSNHEKETIIKINELIDKDEELISMIIQIEKQSTLS